MAEESTQEQSRRDRIELIAAILIGLAAVLTAIATYQSGALSGEVRDANTEALAQTSFANDAYNNADAQQAIERDWFFGWLIEYQNDRPAAAYMENAMPPEVWALIEEWDTAVDDGILNPFSPDAQETYASYRELESVELLETGLDYMVSAQCAILDGRIADNKGGWFDLAAVFLAITLVTGGIAALLKSRIAQHLVLGTAAFCLLIGAVLLVAGGDSESARDDVIAEVFEAPEEALACDNN